MEEKGYVTLQVSIRSPSEEGLKPAGEAHVPLGSQVSIRSPSEEGLKPSAAGPASPTPTSFNPQPLRRGAEAAARHNRPAAVGAVSIRSPSEEGLKPEIEAGRKTKSLVSIRSPSEEGLKHAREITARLAGEVSIRSPSEEGLKLCVPALRASSIVFQSAAPPKRG